MVKVTWDDVINGFKTKENDSHEFVLCILFAI